MGTPNRPVIRYFGGKWLLAPWIISHFPSHKIYVEPFGGAGSVLMRKPRSYAEVYNDLDGDIVNLFRVLQDPILMRQLERKLRLTPFAREEFDLTYRPTSVRIERARRLIIRAYMGFGSDGHNTSLGKTGFRSNSNRSGTTPAHDWANFPDEIQNFCERLNGVVIENRDALEIMAQQDSPETLHFCDPPYVHETRSKGHGYLHEMTNEEHVNLCEFLKTLKGMVVLCGYESPIYTELGWERVERVSLADGARERKEILWLNPAAAQKQNQLSLFINEGAG